MDEQRMEPDEYILVADTDSHNHEAYVYLHSITRFEGAVHYLDYIELDRSSAKIIGQHLLNWGLTGQLGVVPKAMIEEIDG